MSAWPQSTPGLRPRKLDQALAIPGAALARTEQLVEGQAVRIESDGTFVDSDGVQGTLAYVWLADGRNLGEELLREGLVRLQLTEHPYAYEPTYAAAQAAAVGQRNGSWSPDVCPVVDPPPGLEAYVTSMLDNGQTVSIALNALHQQTVSSAVYPKALLRPEWQQGTGYALEELRTAGTSLQKAPLPPESVQPLAKHLALLGSDLLVQVDAYSLGLGRQDSVLLGTSDRELQTTGTSLQPLLEELVAVAAGYRFSND